MPKLIVAIALFGLAATAASAHADSLDRPCTDKPESAYLPFTALSAKVAEQGYEIRGGKIKKTCGKFEVIDKTGKSAKLFVDPTSGAIVAGAGGETVGKADNGATESKADDEGEDD